jgi:hypothetical protein
MTIIPPKTICSGFNISQALSSSVTGTTYSWTATGDTGTTGFSNSTGITISQVLNSSSFLPRNVNYFVTPLSPNGV